MADLATLDDLAARLGVEVDDLDVAQAQTALANASGIVRSLAGPPRQDLEFVAQETVILRGGTRVLALPQRPEVVNDDNPLTVVELGDFGAVDFVCVEGRDFERLGGELNRGHPWWRTSKLMGWPYNRPLGTWAQKVQVTYSHGYPRIPEEIKAVTLDVAQMLHDNPKGLRSVRIDDFSEDYSSEALGAFTTAGIKSRLGNMGYRRGAHSIHLG